MYLRHVLIFILIVSHVAFSKHESSTSSLSSLTSSTSSNDSSLSSSTSSSRKSSLSTCSSISSLNSSDEEEKNTLEPQYDYFDEQYIKSFIDKNYRYVLVATGWSESSLGKMNIKNAQKQKRSFPMSYLLADRINNMGGKSMIIYQTTAPINRDYRKYLFYISHRHELDGLDEELIDTKVANFERNSIRISYLNPKGRRKKSSEPNRYLYSGENAFRRIKVPKILNGLERSKFEKVGIVGFTAHFSGPHLEKHASAWNLPYLVNPSSQAYRIKKSESRKSFRDAGVRHPRGSYEPAFTKEDLARDIYLLLMEIDNKKIVLKLDESAGGYGNKVMRFDEFDKYMIQDEAHALIMSKLNDYEKFPSQFVERIQEENGGAIVEEFIVGDDFTSPASVYMISGEDKVSIRYTYDQLLGGVDNQDFKGSLGPIPLLDDESSNIVLMSEKVGLHLSRQGVRGNVGTDFVIITNEYGERVAYAIENNVRNTGTSYPYNALKMLVGEEVLKHKYMKAFDDVKIPLIGLKAYREKIQELFYQHLRTHPLSFDKSIAKGCLVHHDTFRIGKIGVVCVADSLDEARQSFDEFTESIEYYLTNLPETKAYEKFVPLYEALMDEEEEIDEHIPSSLHRSESNYSLADSALSSSGSTISFNIFEDDGYIEEISHINGQEERRVRFID